MTEHLTRSFRDKQLPELAAFLDLLQVDSRAFDDLRVEGDRRLIRSRHRLVDAVSAAQLLIGAAAAQIWHDQTGRRTDVTIDTVDALHSLHASHFVWQQGAYFEVGAEYVQVNGFHPTADGRQVLLCAGPPYPKLLNGYLNFFNCGNNRAAIDSVTLRYTADQLEAELSALGLPACRAFSPEEWRAHPQGQLLAMTPVIEIEKLADGFFSISGAAVDAAGKLFFVDHHEQRIFGWSAQEGLTIERDNPLDPVNLAFDKAGDLLVLSSDGAQGTVYSFRPGSPADQLTLLAPQPAAPHPGASALLPGNYWNNGEFKDQLDPSTLRYTTLPEMFARDVSSPAASQYVAPDGSVFLRAGRVFQQGPPDSSGWRFSDNLDTYGFISAAPGQRVYVSSASEDRTYSAVVGADGTLADLEIFAERGGESVAVDASGNVYVANGQIFVYNRAGKQIAEIDVPERPIDIVFGAADHRLLFILAHHALFAVEVGSPQ